MDRAHATRFYVAVALGVAASIAGIVAFGPRRESTPSSTARTTGDASIVAWCAPGLEPIDGGGCYAQPAKAAPFPLLVYLHGLHTPQTIGEEHERQARVARRALAKGFAVLALHGEKGACSSPELTDTFCFPSSEKTAERAPKVFSGFTQAIDAAHARGAKAEQYLLGFSNGGYFAFLIATRRLGRFDAIAIAHAGPVGQLRDAIGQPTPLLLETADDDPSNGEMIALDALLTREKWPHVITAREGGHTIADWNVDTALSFFVRFPKERWPLVPPFPTRAPKPPEARPEGGAETPAPSASAPASAEHPPDEQAPATNEPAPTE